MPTLLARRRAVRPRLVRTRLSATDLRDIFRTTVSGGDWSIVDDGNPIVAQSRPLDGTRQQIALHIDPGDPGDPGRAAGTEARIAVVRYSRRALGRTAKAHALRLRMKAFLTAVRSADVSASVAN